MGRGCGPRGTTQIALYICRASRMQARERRPIPMPSPCNGGNPARPTSQNRHQRGTVLGLSLRLRSELRPGVIPGCSQSGTSSPCRDTSGLLLSVITFTLCCAKNYSSSITAWRAFCTLGMQLWILWPQTASRKNRRSTSQRPHPFHRFPVCRGYRNATLIIP